jgi:hypothetical protein
MPNKSLLRRRIPVPMGLRTFNDPPHFGTLLLAQVHLSRRKVLLQAVHFCGTRDGNQPLGSDPRKSNLADRAPLARGYLLDTFDDGFVLVKVFALEFGDCNLTLAVFPSFASFFCLR